tara:strand:+ start:5230 stop:5406 length:177 start_codon:yes stop_codon:yes gene_type:complete
MITVKLYKIYAIADNLKTDITYMSGTKSDKLQEIKDLCEEIAKDYDKEILKRYDNSIL